MKLNSKRIERLSKKLKVKSYKCVTSTNDIAKSFVNKGCDEGLTIVALEQTSGRGRFGRTFLSKKGGAYFSIVLKPQQLSQDTLFITVAAAVAAANAIEKISNKQCKIKWVNDIYINEKKVCGILAESVFNQENEVYVILGVGINLFKIKKGFPSNLPLAACVFEQKQKKLFKNRIKEDVISAFATNFFENYYNLSKKEYINEYIERSFLTGKTIKYEENKKIYFAKVIGINTDAQLVVESNEKQKTLSFGEIQIIGMEQPSI